MFWRGCSIGQHAIRLVSEAEKNGQVPVFEAFVIRHFCPEPVRRTERGGLILDAEFDLDQPQWRPSAASVCLACAGVVLMFAALVAMVYFELPRILE